MQVAEKLKKVGKLDFQLLQVAEKLEKVEKVGFSTFASCPKVDKSWNMLACNFCKLGKRWRTLAQLLLTTFVSWRVVEKVTCIWPCKLEKVEKATFLSCFTVVES